MLDDLVNLLVPSLRKSTGPVFNVFDVMHHGRHEKQLSNVFAWLLDAKGSHGLGDLFPRIFVEEVNRSLPAERRLSVEPYSVQQEVNVRPHEEGADIADIVLIGETTMLVIENYWTSDGHGHSYAHYLGLAENAGKQGAVVLLCRNHEQALLGHGWEHASVVTYAGVLDRLKNEMPATTHDEVRFFVEHMHRRFTKGLFDMSDSDSLDFIVAMCEADEAGRYASQPHEKAERQLGEDLALRAEQRMKQSRDVLSRTKKRLREFAAGPLKTQLDATRGAGFVLRTQANYSNIVCIVVAGEAPVAEQVVDLSFGPPAWYAIERQGHELSEGTPDYRTVFVMRTEGGRIIPTTVTIDEVLAGLAPDDQRLHDAVLKLLGS